MNSRNESATFGGLTLIAESRRWVERRKLPMHVVP